VTVLVIGFGTSPCLKCLALGTTPAFLNINGDIRSTRLKLTWLLPRLTSKSKTL
jgi:hypothetical protein